MVLSEDKEFNVTKKSAVLSNVSRDKSMIEPCNHEEADTRMLLHVADAVNRGHKKVMIRTVNTDVVVVAVSCMQKLPALDELWIHIGTGKNHTYIPCHSIANALEPERAEVLPIFHALTGCDTVSFFNGRGKKSAFDAWIAYPEVTCGFKALLDGRIKDADSYIQKFVITMYDRSSPCTTVNEFRKYLFTKKDRQLENIPPTEAALHQHILRAIYQVSTMAEAMEVDSVLTECTNSDNTDTTKSDASAMVLTDEPASSQKEKATDEPVSVLQEKATDEPALALLENTTDVPTSVLQEKVTDEPTLVLQEKVTDVPASTLQEKATDEPTSVLHKTADEPESALQEKPAGEPQVTLENSTECEALVKEKSPPNQEPNDETDSTNYPNLDAITIDEPVEKVVESEPLVDNTPKQKSSIETATMDKQDTNIQEKLLNGKLNTNISISQPDEKSEAQEVPTTTEPVTTCREANEDRNIPNDGEDIPLQESMKKFDRSLNNDCELIADTLPTVDLTMDDSITEATPLCQKDIRSITDKNLSEKPAVDTTFTELQTDSSNNESGNPQIEDQNDSTDLTVGNSPPQETPITQSNSGVEPETVKNDNLKENEPSKDISMKNSVINETPKEQNNLKDLPEKRNQNIEEDITMKECNTNESSDKNNAPEIINQSIEEDIPVKESSTNESSNKQTVSTTSEPKQDQINKSADKTDLKETATQNSNVKRNKKKLCVTCFKYHQDEVCWHAKGPQKRENDQLDESPAAKKQKAGSKYPADMVSLIARQIHSPPDMSAWTKLKLIRECQILYLNHIPTSWSHTEMKEFMKKHVECINEIHETCFFLFVRDAKFNRTGECLIKFKNSDYCQKTWFDLRDAKIEDKPVSVELDLGHNIMKQVRKDSRMRGKPLDEQNNVDTEVSQPKSQGNENCGAGNSAANTSQTGGAGGTSSGVGRDNKIFVKPKLSYMPPEKFDNTTYGLNEGFLQSLGLRLPLCNVIIVLGLEFDLDDDKIKEVFSLAGTVKRAFRVLKKDGGPTGKGIVEYDHPVEAVQAVSMFQGKQLNGRNLIIKMAPKAFPRPLPEGLSEVGPGLGFEGEPMRGVRPLIELQSLRKMLMDFKNTFNSKIAELEKSIASLNKSVAALNAKKAEPEPRKKVPTPPPQTQPSDAANQLVTALSSLAQPNVLMGLTTLLSAQGLVQHGVGADQAAMANAMQNQMMMQNTAYAQNVNMQGMQQSMLPGAFPQPGLAQPQMMQPMDQSQMFFGQTQMMQPGYMAMQAVQTPASVAAAPVAAAPVATAPVAVVPQINPQPTTSHVKPTQPVVKQQTQAYTPKVPENKAPSKNQATSNWNVTPTTAPVSQKQKSAAPKPSYSSESTHYKRPSRFDMKEKPNYNLKVIETEPEPEKKNDLLVFSNLPPSVTVHALNAKMREVGDVVFGEMTGRGRALVRFKQPRDADRCIKLFNRSKVDGQVITVEYF